MNDRLLAVALVLMLASLPLVSIGSWNDLAFVWWIGLALLAIGAAIPPAMRFLADDDADDAGDAGDGDGGGGER
jgi:hypothetical protein